MYELCLKKKRIPGTPDPVPVETPTDVAKYVNHYCYDEAESWRESSWLLTLDKTSRITGQFLLSTGNTDNCEIDPKLVAKVALGNLATSIVITHNHPGGNCMPSKADIENTAKIRRVINAVGILFTDHVVMGEKNCYSFSENKVYNI